MVLLVGLYLATCSLINTFDVRAPRSERAPGADDLGRG
jgi:hypothetical protein